MVLSGAGTTLIQAFENSSLQFVAPENARIPRKFELRLKGQLFGAASRIDHAPQRVWLPAGGTNWASFGVTTKRPT